MTSLTFPEYETISIPPRLMSSVSSLVLGVAGAAAPNTLEQVIEAAISRQ
jgi:hypothetical protein